MAIAFNAATDGTDNGGTTNSLTFSHTVSSGANRLLVVGVLGDTAGSNDDVTGITYNGVAMTFVRSNASLESPLRYTYFYYLLAPASGAHNVVISSTTTHYILGGAADYTGVLQSGQPDASTDSVTAAPASSKTTSITTVADNSWVVLFESGFNSNNAPSASTGDTRRVFNAAFGNWGLFDSNSAVTPAGSYNMTTTRTSNDHKIAHLLVSFSPDTGGGGGGGSTPGVLLIPANIHGDLGLLGGYMQ